MTLDIFIKTIKKAGNIPGSLDEIAIELYRYSEIYASESTIIESRKGRRTPKYDSGSISESGFIQYFKERTTSTWSDMQRAFDELDNYGFINRDTKDAEVFYSSLLALFYELIRLVPVSLRHIIPEKPLLFGRKDELKQIENVFKTGNYAVLTGIGGIGKSHVALAYAHSLYESGGWIIQHFICEDSDTLRKSVIQLQFDGSIELKKSKKDPDRDYFDRRVNVLKNRQMPTLIVLDNLNQPFASEDRKDIQKLIECGRHIRLLITSRNNLVYDKQRVIHILPLDNNSMLELYSYHRFDDPLSHRDYIARHRAVLEKMFALVEKHTLMITLLAKLPGRSFLSESEIYELLDDGLNIPLETVNITKDGAEIEDSVKGIIKKIFNIAQLTEVEKTIMRYLSLVPLGGVDHKLFEELTGYSAKEIIGLKNGHWVTLNEETLKFRLHPLICDTILSLDETKPSKEICNKFITRLSTKLKSSTHGSPAWHTLNKTQACVISKLFFPPNYFEEPYANMFENLKDEYRDTLISLNKSLIKYSNTDVPEKNE